MAPQTLVLLQALLVTKKDFTLTAIAVFSCYLMLSKKFGSPEFFPTRAAHVGMQSGDMLLQGFCGNEETITHGAVAVLTGKLMRFKFLLGAEGHATIIAPERPTSRLVLPQGFLVDEFFAALLAIKVALGVLVG